MLLNILKSCDKTINFFYIPYVLRAFPTTNIKPPSIWKDIWSTTIYLVGPFKKLLWHKKYGCFLGPLEELGNNAINDVPYFFIQS